MARAFKQGIDYFSHDTDMSQDIKIKLIEATHPHGYKVFNKLLEIIYRDEGYYLIANDDFNILFANDNNMPLNDYLNIRNDCINRNLFDINLFNEYKILTSKRIQENYIDATQRRKEVAFIEEYLLVLDIEKKYRESVNVCINKINVDINLKNADINSQSKVKESKEKKSKVKESKKDIAHAKAPSKNKPRKKQPAPEKISFAEFVSMTNDEYSSLVAKLGELGTERCIEILDNYKGSSGKMYISDYRAILSWVVNEYHKETANIKNENIKNNKPVGNPFLDFNLDEYKSLSGKEAL